MTTATASAVPLEKLPHPFTSAQATALGVSRAHLRLSLHESRVRRVLRNVYVRADAPDTIESRASALGLVAPPYAVICDRTAAWLWGVDAFRHWELDALPPLETFVLRGRPRVRRQEARGGERDLRPEDIVSVGDIWVTTPLRTSLDLGCKLPRHQALAVMDGFARVQGVTSADLATLLPRYRGRRGVVQARTLVPLVDGRTESTGESFVKLDIADAGLPAPEPQFEVKVGGVVVYRLDLAYPRLKICIEYDGKEFHSSPEAKENDRQRRKWLRDHGWVVIVVTKDDLRGAKREAWLDELRSTLRDRMR